MMRLTILVSAFGLALANYLPETTSVGASVTTPGYGGVTTPEAAVTTPPAASVTTPGATTGSGYGGVTTPAAAVTTPTAAGVTTPCAEEGGSTPAGQKGQGGHSKFRCNRKPSGKNILNLDPILSVENLCFAVCKNSTTACSNANDNSSGLLAPVECLTNSLGDALTPSLSCLIPCILNVNALETCNAGVITNLLVKRCSSLQKKPVCAAVCACCALENDPLLNVCIDACVKADGIDVNAVAPGLLPPINVPVKLGS